MLVVRLLVLLGLLAIGGSLVVYLVTRDPRYLRLAWQLFKFALVFLTGFGVLYVLERLILM